MKGLKKFFFLHLGVRGKHVQVGRDAHVGPFSRIWAPQNLSIGKGFYCGKFVTIECDGVIGDFVLIANNVGIIGRNDHDHNQVGSPITSADWVGNTSRLSSNLNIGSDVWIGFGAIILGPISIGDHAIIAAGAVVREDVPEFSIVSGNPAKVVALRFKSDSERATHKSNFRKNVQDISNKKIAFYRTD